jgi:hypothetical protein
LEAQNMPNVKTFALAPLQSFWTWSLNALRATEYNFLTLNLQLLAPKVGDQMQKKLFRPQVEFLSSKLGSSKTCWTQKNCFILSTNF